MDAESVLIFEFILVLLCLFYYLTGLTTKYNLAFRFSQLAPHWQLVITRFVLMYFVISIFAMYFTFTVFSKSDGEYFLPSVMLINTSVAFCPLILGFIKNKGIDCVKKMKSKELVVKTVSDK